MLLYLTYLKKEYVTLFNRLFNFRAKRLGHISIKAKMCVLPLVSYDDKTETLDYGQCFTIDVISMSLNSMTVIWRSSGEAGINIIMMREQDKTAILKMMANKSKK